MLGRLQQPIGYYENIGEESLLVGHQSHDFILGCTFSQTACAHSNFTLFQNAQYFNCYTFHGGSRTDVNAISTMSGPHQGLSLVLYLENDNGNNVFFVDVMAAGNRTRLPGSVYNRQSPVSGRSQRE